MMHVSTVKAWVEAMSTSSSVVEVVMKTLALVLYCIAAAAVVWLIAMI